MRTVKEGPLSAESTRRIERLTEASPLYALELRRNPWIAPWLEEPRNLRESFRFHAFLDTWREFAPDAANIGDDARLGALRRWRRLMSMRIAHRSVNDLADEPATVEELTLLAEFCLRECTLLSIRRWKERLGEPWDRARGAEARFCVLALGKLGGRELNFSSDIDLLYLYEGEGSCRKAGAETSLSNGEFYTKVAETITRALDERTEDGFLFRTDVRLRPEGAIGPLVRSLTELEYYYSTAGQTWERLALIKARGVAGSLELGAELLESLHGFRYPRHPPPSLLAEVAAMKARSDAEIVGSSALDRDVKLGTGGIREIEFVAQSLQLLNAGRYPFLQTHSTEQALELLARYGLMDASDAAMLGKTYWFLRKAEHRLQIREEEQTHLLPRKPEELAPIAASLGFDSAQDFTNSLRKRCGHAHRVYADLFAGRGVDTDFEAWWAFFSTERVPETIMRRIGRWFGGDPGAADALRIFACGGRHALITRELVVRFQHVAGVFDGFYRELARPLVTLARLARVAGLFGTHRQFLGFCAENPRLFRVFSILCDRSEAIVELLCAHPEIIEEVLRPEILRRRRSARDLDEDISAAARTSGFPEWLRLYVRAEQVRHAMGGILGDLRPEEIEAAISELADAVLRQLAMDSGVLVVALGKYGGAELAFGSDLDLLFVTESGMEEEAARVVDKIRAALGMGQAIGAAFALDLRLRPHGQAGPIATSIAALETSPRAGGGGQFWERQSLVRARAVAGPAPLAATFRAWLDGLIYSAPVSDAEIAQIGAMRARIEKELGGGPPGAAFKAGVGGLADIEFLTQALQLRHGHAHPSLRVPGTRGALRALALAGKLPPEAEARLLDNYEFLRRIETALRLDANRSVSLLPTDPADLEALARWVGFPDADRFMAEHLRRIGETRRIFDKMPHLLELCTLP
jgi:[glutamine synthetase] adenylyltransferase / [glutamine synthetase]-adenylyl-L-tyrosine phosphorylase